MRQFLTTLLVVWTAACIATYLYSQQQNIPSGLAMAVLPAFLVEFGFYLVLGFPKVRAAFDGLGSKPLRAAMLTASAVLPYLILSALLGTFHFTALATLAGVALAVSFFYVRIHGSMPADVLFLALLAAVYLTKIFDPIYGQIAPHAQLSILGRLMCIRVSIMAVLSLRPMEDAHLGFVPTLRECRIGVVYYLFFLPLGAGIAYLVKFAHYHPPDLVWWKVVLLVVATIAAFFWVVALFEEFFFRAFLQQLLIRGLRGQVVGLIATSILFGAVHLLYRQFPNWRFAVVGGVSGIFYGLAFLKAKSVRASMVTHALVVATWRVFFSS